ncbi:hypothetical protein As57867_005307, partial [Aphanomyces stellatus]
MNSDTTREGKVVLSLLTAPKLTSFAHDKLVEWLRLWESYTRELKEECKRQSSKYAKLVPTIRSCIDPPHVLTYMAATVWKKKEDELEDEFLLSYIKEKTVKPENDGVPDPEKALADLFWDRSEGDIFQRVVSFLADAHKLVAENSLLDDLENPTSRKPIIREILLKVTPASLRDLVTSHVKREQLKSE